MRRLTLRRALPPEPTEPVLESEPRARTVRFSKPLWRELGTVTDVPHQLVARAVHSRVRNELRRQTRVEAGETVEDLHLAGVRAELGSEIEAVAALDGRTVTEWAEAALEAALREANGPAAGRSSERARNGSREEMGGAV